MKKWFQKLGAQMKQAMQGRYGMDEFSRFLSGTGLVLLLLSLFKALRFLYIPAIVIYLWSCLRCFSKNTYKRRRERDAYLAVYMKWNRERNLQKRKWQERKTHRFYRCKQCKTVLRAPKGKGKIKITCPNCRAEIVKTT